MSLRCDFSWLQCRHIDCSECCREENCTKDCWKLSAKIFLVMILCVLIVGYSQLIIDFYTLPKEVTAMSHILFAVFVLIYGTIHMLLLSIYIYAAEEVYPSYLKAFPKFRYFLYYWVYICAPLLYFWISIPRINYAVNGEKDEFVKMRLGFYSVFVIHAFLELVFFCATCCLTVKPKQETPE